MTDFARARASMIDSQVRTNGVLDLRVIKAMRETPREIFVPEQMRDYAYADQDLFIGVDAQGARRYLLAPMTMGRMLQLAGAGDAGCALAVGCPAGYAAAVLANMAQSVIALESDPAMAEAASSALERAGFTNAAVVTGPLADGWPREAPFDSIIINGRIERTPHALLAQLKDFGRLAAVFGDDKTAWLRIWTRRGETISHADEFTATAPLLPGFEERKPAFAF